MNYQSDIITVATVNFNVAFGDKNANISRIKDYMTAASRRGIDLLVFPEMCTVGYDFYIDDSISKAQKRDNSEPLRGKTNTELGALAKELGLYCVFGTAELDEESDEIYNAAVALGPEGILGAYRKIHPFEKENEWCKKGSDAFMFDTKWGPISVGICYDTYQFPELQRYCVAKGSRLFLNPTALLEDVSKGDSRKAYLNYYLPLLEYGVLCNTIYIASANLLGYDGQNFFGGASGILGPKVNQFAETDVTWYAGGKDNMQPGFSIATIDLSLATRNIFIPDKYAKEPDYRPDVYRKFI